MQLNDQQKEFFSAMETTFNTTGWELLRQGWQAELDRLPEIVFYNAKTVDDLLIARERAKLLNELLSLPAVMTAQQKEIEEMDDESV
jgi:hypothetical protein